MVEPTGYDPARLLIANQTLSQISFDPEKTGNQDRPRTCTLLGHNQKALPIELLDYLVPSLGFQPRKENASKAFGCSVCLLQNGIFSIFFFWYRTRDLNPQSFSSISSSG